MSDTDTDLRLDHRLTQWCKCRDCRIYKRGYVNGNKHGHAQAKAWDDE